MSTRARLSPLEVATLALDTAHTPAQIGTVDIFDAGPDEFDYERLISLIRDRIRFVPRYRQRIRTVPARLAGPVWTDDEDFDLTFHVRRSALPRPGTRDQLLAFVGRVMARRMDRSRPLWELYLVEGLENNRFALLSKSHQSLVDGIDTVEIGQVLLDTAAERSVGEGARFPPDAAVVGGAAGSVPDPAHSQAWRPEPEPSAVELIAGALREGIADPSRALSNAQQTVTGALGVAVAVGEAVGGLGGTLGELAQNALMGVRPPAEGPLTGVVSEQRRFATVSASLADFKAVRAEHRHTVNDVVLAMITGGLRSWLLTRGESVSSTKRLTALVPMSVTDADGEPSALGSQVAPHLMSLPIGEPNALMRLHQVAYGTQAHKDTGRAIGARTISDLAGFAPTTLHALGVRVSGETLRRQHDVLITNAPGPQVPLYAAGSQMVASYPVVPLEPGHLLAIGVTSYNGRVFLGLNADRYAFRDLDVLAQCMSDALEELLDTTARASATRQPTRQASPEAKLAARRAAAKKAVAKKLAAERAARRRAAVKKALAEAAPARKSAAGRASAPPAEQPVAKKTPATKASANKAAAKKAPAKKAAAKKAAAKKTPANTTSAKKTPANTTSAKKAPAKKAPAKAPAKKPPAKKAPAKKAPAKKAPTESSAAPTPLTQRPPRQRRGPVDGP